MISGIGNTPTGSLTFDSGLTGATLSTREGDTKLALFATVEFSIFRELVETCAVFYEIFFNYTWHNTIV